MEQESKRMKGIIVVDEIPKCCGECFFLSENGECVAEDISSVDDQNSKPYWCPIKPLPEKDTEDYEYDEFHEGMKTGWNWCIDKILEGEKENEE